MRQKLQNAVRKLLPSATYNQTTADPDNPVDIFYWKPSHGHNFGDFLASVIVQRMLAMHEIVPNEPRQVPARLLSIGSVLHFAQTGDTLWGTGRNGKVPQDEHQFKSLDVRAVRGPRTRQFLGELGIQAPEVFGDPALLLPHLFEKRLKRCTEKGKVGVVPNLHDIALMQDQDFINPRANWDEVIKEILTCDFVISSSLHGLIVADAFGIDCCHLRLSDTEPDFKYLDYCEGVGRTQFRSARSIEEAMQIGAMPKIDYSPDQLMAAFPIDLWQEAT